MNTAVSKDDSEGGYEPTVIASVGPFVCSHYLNGKQAIAFRGIGAVIGAFLLHLAYGHFYTMANMAPYIMGYMTTRINSALESGLAVWLPITSLGIQSVFMPLGGLLCSIYGYRWVVGLSCLTGSFGVFVTYFSIKRSFLSVIFTYSLLNGAGLGLGYTVVLAVASSWFANQRGCVFGIVVGGLGLSTLVFTPIQTAYLNPNNFAVDNETGLFKDKAVLDRVPSVFCLLGGCLFAIQITGFLLLTRRPNDLGAYVEPESFGDLCRHMNCICCPCLCRFAVHQEHEGQISSVGCFYNTKWELKASYHVASSANEGGRARRKLEHEVKREEKIEDDQVKVDSGGKLEQSEQAEGLSQPNSSQYEETDSEHTEELKQRMELNKTLLERPGVSEVLQKPYEPETQLQIAIRPWESIRFIARQRRKREKRKCQNETVVLKQSGQHHADIDLLASGQGVQSVQKADSQDDTHQKDQQRQNRVNDQREELQSTSKVVDHEKETVDAEEWKTEPQKAQAEQELLENSENQELNRNVSPCTSPEHLKTSGVTSHVQETNYCLVRMLQSLDFYLLWLVVFFGVVSVAVVTDTYEHFGQKYISDKWFVYVIMVISVILNSLGRILWGILVDKLSFKVPLCIVLFFSTALLATFPHLSYATGLSLKILYTIWVCLIFTLLGGLYTIVPMAVSTIFGPANMVVNYGIIFSAQAFASILSALMTTSVKSSISYVAQFTCCSILCLVALFILVWIEDRKINPYMDIFPHYNMRNENFDDRDAGYV